MLVGTLASCHRSPCSSRHEHTSLSQVCPICTQRVRSGTSQRRRRERTARCLHPLEALPSRARCEQRKVCLQGSPHRAHPGRQSVLYGSGTPPEATPNRMIRVTARPSCPPTLRSAEMRHRRWTHFHVLDGICMAALRLRTGSFCSGCPGAGIGRGLDSAGLGLHAGRQIGNASGDGEGACRGTGVCCSGSRSRLLF